MTEREYQPIPVEVARGIGQQFNKSKVVIAAYDPEFGKTCVTTYGRTADDKLCAADVGDRVGAMLSEGRAGERHEDFRLRAQGEMQAERDRLARERDAILRAAVWEHQVLIREGGREVEKTVYTTAVGNTYASAHAAMSSILKRAGIPAKGV